MKYEFSIVVPAYNEEERLGDFLKSLVDSAPPLTEIIVISDGDDGTSDIARSFGDKVRLLEYSERLGKGGAILEGLRVAKGSTVGFVDADGAISAAETYRLASMVNEERQCVIGSRWVRGSSIGRAEPTVNQIVGRAFHYLVFLVLGLKVKDTQCGAKFLHSSLAKSICKRVTVKSRMIDVAILYHVKLIGQKIAEVGIHWDHKEGTKLRISKAIPLMFLTLVALKFIHSPKFKIGESKIRRISREIRFRTI